jgi:hypothetical protein
MSVHDALESLSIISRNNQATGSHDFLVHKLVHQFAPA